MPDRYNRMQEEIDALEAEGKLFVIRPDQPVTVSRFERDKMKLQELYGDGRRVAEERMEAMCSYLNVPVPEVDLEVVQKENALLAEE